MYGLLDQHFTLLDKAKIGEASIFGTKKDKQRYETLLMYSYRKLKAAQYHNDNVRKFILKEQDELANVNLPDGKYSQYSYKSSHTADEYIFELSAFLEAVKSSLDFLAEVSSFYWRGVTTNYSISPLLKLVGKGQRGSILNEIAHYFEWLSGLREYRHHLVHRLVPTTRNGYHVEQVGGKTAKVYIPVVIPIQTPSFTPDTRADRMEEAMMGEEYSQFPGLAFSSSVSKMAVSGGLEEVTEFELQVDPIEGYKPIDVFMDEHLSIYIEFSETLIQSFDGLNFGYAEMLAANPALSRPGGAPLPPA